MIVLDAADCKRWAAGTELPAWALDPISRLDLALYAGGSNDHNPLHLDPDFARAAGLPDVIGQGMLTMALLSRYVTQLAPQSALREFSVRFLAMSRIGDRLTCRGRVAEILSGAKGAWAVLDLSATRQDGETLVAGRAVVAIGGADASAADRLGSRLRNTHLSGAAGPSEG